MAKKKKIVICGAGIAGIATAYYLLKYSPETEMILLDKHQPLSFTSSKSGENFRDYWPHKSMEALSQRSIDLMAGLQAEYGAGSFKLDFSGYHFVSHDEDKSIFTDDSSPSFRARNTVNTDATSIHAAYPYLDQGIRKSVFIKKAGNVDSITMANLLFETAKGAGLKFREGEITDLKSTEAGIVVSLDTGQVLIASHLIIAAGPFINQLANKLGLNFPVTNTFQRKILLPDPLGIIPPSMPFTIYSDGQYLGWAEDERAFLQKEEGLQWMAQQFPGGIHIKPDAGRIKLGWAFSNTPVEPEWKTGSADYFTQVVLKGASRFIPALAAYVENTPTPVIEYGGYYTRTRENWPLIGETDLPDVHVIGALAGFGTMTACAAGELCAKTLLTQPLPWYAPYFSPQRYRNPVMLDELNALEADGQL